MKSDKGKLRIAKKKSGDSFFVTLPTKKGSAEFSIPQKALYFRPADAEDGSEVDVERDDSNRIVKVTIPGKAEVSPHIESAQPHGDRRHRGRGKDRASRGKGRGRRNGGPTQPTAVRGLEKASTKVIGLEFHNPYTFLPFSKQAPKRRPITPLSIDEAEDEADRFTGVLQLEVTTESPLLTCHPKEISEQNGHKTYDALTIGSDVILPATGVRGSLRTLLTVLTGGTLGYLNEHAYLCQGRDANLGPAGPNSPPGTPANVFLAEVVQPGTAFKPGKVRVGQTKLVFRDALERANRGKRLPEGIRGPKLWVGLDDRDQPTAVKNKESAQTPWKLKVSGRPINLRGKREGLLLANGPTIDLPAELWAAYSGRNVHGDRPDLRKGDLIWLEPANPDAAANSLRRAEDVKSIQWARWGRHGEGLKDHLDRHAPQVLPDYLQSDGQVDEVTNLFGQVSPRRGEALAHAARIRLENLVFMDAAPKVETVTLAPLAPPHPGCVAFYRENESADNISESDALRGYKVYRTQAGDDAPWRFDVQGVYGKQGELLDKRQKVNKTCQLIPKGISGKLSIAFRGLTRRELALVMQACAVPWRLGGGKPLGLGLCNVAVKAIIGEDGEDLLEQFNDWEAEVSDIGPRVRMWEASQQGVARLRYPRAVDANRFGKSRGGHAWFARHAKPRMVTGKGDGNREPGVEPLYIEGALRKAVEDAAEPLDPTTPMIAGQILPLFDTETPETDVMYGYDGFCSDVRDEQRPRRRVFRKIEAFDPEKHVTGQETSEGSHGKDREFRQRNKDERKQK